MFHKIALAAIVSLFAVTTTTIAADVKKDEAPATEEKTAEENAEHKDHNKDHKDHKEVK